MARESFILSSLTVFRGVLPAILVTALAQNCLFGSPVFAEIVNGSEVQISCERTLDQANHGEVDWIALEKHLMSLGYSKEIAIKKIEEHAISPKEIESKVRELLNLSGWSVSDGFSKIQMNQFSDEVLKSDGDHSKNIASEILYALPYWAEVPGFDPRLFAWSQLNALLGTTSHKDPGVSKIRLISKPLTYYYPLWFDRSQDLEEIVRAMMTGTESPIYAPTYGVRTLLDQLDEEGRGEVYEYIRERMPNKTEFPSAVLSYATILPLEKVPEGLTEELKRQARIDIETPSIVKGVKTLGFAYVGVGSCPVMTCGHLNTLFNEDPDKRKNPPGLLISVQGEVIGSLKFFGNNSFLGIRNVVDADGRLVVAMGGVYNVPKGIFSKLKKIREDSGDQRLIVEFDEFGLRPFGFMLGDRSTDKDNTSTVLAVVAEKLSRSALEKALDGLIDSDLYLSSSISNRIQIANELTHEMEDVIIKRTRQAQIKNVLDENRDVVDSAILDQIVDFDHSISRASPIKKIRFDDF